MAALKPWTGALAVAIAAFALFALTMSRVVTFEDAGLFDSVCATNGIAHPPGYPLFTLMCVPLFHLPLEPAIIGNAMSALFGALTCGLLVLVLESLGLARTIAIVGGLLLAVSRTFWSQAIIVEVYTLNTLIFLVTLWLCIRFYQAPDRRLAWLICLTFSLGMANHWPLMVLAFPGLAVICLARLDWIRAQWTDPRFWGFVVLAVAAGIAPYASLLLHHPGISFSGPITSLSGLWDYFMRKAYTGVDQQSGANIIDKWRYFLWFVREVPREFGTIALLFALAGIVVAPRRFGRPVAAGLVVIFLANSVGLILLLGFEYGYTFQAIFRPYPLESWICLAIWSATGLAWLYEQLSRTSRLAAPIASITGGVVVLIALVLNYPFNNRASDNLAADYANVVLETLPPGANIVTSSDDDTFPLAYLRYVKQVRDDVTPYQLKNVVFPERLPGNTLAERAAAVLDLASASPTFGFFGLPGLPNGTNWGLYQQYPRGKGPAAAENPALNRFRHRLIEDWFAHTSRDPTEREFIGQALINYTGQLLELSYSDQLSAADARDLDDLQKTFSGRFMTVAFSVNHPDYNISGKELLDLAFRAEAHIPPEATRLTRATFHYALALVYLSGHRGVQVNALLARQLLLKSFEDLPSPRTPGLCMLLRMHPPAGHLSLTPPFVNACKRPVGGKN